MKAGMVCFVGVAACLCAQVATGETPVAPVEKALTLEEGFREKWYGKTPQEALAVEALPVTGATYSSNAVCDLVWAAATAVRDYLAAPAEKKEEN